MYGLTSKLKKWQEAGLLSIDQANQIADYEKSRYKSKFQSRLTYVALFAIVLGILSIVAANWYAIPASLKIAGHFILNIAVAYGILSNNSVHRPLWREGCVLLLFGLFLTFIALVGQVYQLHGKLAYTLSVWVVMCAPFIWYYGRTYFAMWPWLLALITAVYLILLEHIETSHAEIVTAISALYFPIILLAVAKIPLIARYRPGFIKSLRGMGIGLICILTTIAIVAHHNLDYTDATIWWIFGGFASAFLFILACFWPRKSAPAQNGFELFVYLLISTGLYTLMLTCDAIPRFVGAILFIGYWGMIAWMGARIQSAHIMDWAIRLIILRLIFVYIELFGGLLTTGVGLVVSGILLLIVLRYFNRILAMGRKLVQHAVN